MRYLRGALTVVTVDVVVAVVAAEEVGKKVVDIMVVVDEETGHREYALIFSALANAIVVTHVAMRTAPLVVAINLRGLSMDRKVERLSK